MGTETRFTGFPGTIYATADADAMHEYDALPAFELQFRKQAWDPSQYNIATTTKEDLTSESTIGDDKGNIYATIPDEAIEMGDRQYDSIPVHSGYLNILPHETPNVAVQSSTKRKAVCFATTVVLIVGALAGLFFAGMMLGAPSSQSQSTTSSNSSNPGFVVVTDTMFTASSSRQSTTTFTSTSVSQSTSMLQTTTLSSSSTTATTTIYLTTSVTSTTFSTTTITTSSAAVSITTTVTSTTTRTLVNSANNIYIFGSSGGVKGYLPINPTSEALSISGRSTWRNLTIIPPDIYPKLQAAAIYKAGLIYIIGGYCSMFNGTVITSATFAPCRTTNVYNITSQTWDIKANISQTRPWTSAIDYNGTICMIGGTYANGFPAKNVECYDSTADSWYIKMSIPEASASTFAAVARDTIYYANGFGGKTFKYITSNSSWVQLQTMPQDQYYGTSTVFQDAMYVFGTSRTAARLSMFNFTTEQWSILLPPPFTYTLQWASAVTVNSTIYIMGGNNNNRYDARSVWLYYPLNNSWEPGPPLYVRCLYSPLG